MTERAVEVTGVAEAVDVAQVPWTVLKVSAQPGTHVEDAPKDLNVKMEDGANGQRQPIARMSSPTRPSPCRDNATTFIPFDSVKMTRKSFSHVLHQKLEEEREK